MPILFALVARGTTVLVEHISSGLSGNFSTVTSVLLQKIPSDSNSKMSYVYDKHLFHYVVSNGMTYLCMTDEETGRVLPFKFLDDIEKRFVSTYGDRAKTAIAYSLRGDFGPVLRTQMEYYNTSRREHDKLEQVKDEVDAVKGIMINNIESVLERGEKIELLVDKSEKLEGDARRFKKSARRFKNHMWWQNVKVMLLIFIIVALAIYFILAMFCGFDVSCGSSGGGDDNSGGNDGGNSG
eukprot:GABV01001379.1.p1 GENE.GABV01001379.1~~GABV01001379.1.p1  ORF type:complete len:239 (+),score=93.91 GABV01001379.1:138-854(+)